MSNFAKISKLVVSPAAKTAALFVGLGTASIGLIYSSNRLHSIERQVFTSLPAMIKNSNETLASELLPRMDTLAQTLAATSTKADAIYALTIATHHTVNGLKSDFAGLKSNFAGLKSNFACLKSDFADVKTGVHKLAAHMKEINKDMASIKKALHIEE
ncbi:hypothetical protein B0H11DRAFT_2094727 [Mycena galericulata]|nr:hypothetical protein B0H11DRAFT_2094727 [Mycena galericulata]